MELTITKFAHLQIPLEDVLNATKKFHHDNIIGHGGFSTTYKGRLLQSGKLMEIAAQRFDCKHGEGDLEFLTEISMLSDLKHANLVSIIGFCDEQDEKVVITTYEAKGRLEQYLKSLNLTWTQRLRIAIGVARALSYLHYDKGRDYAIIHCNINSNTILLDNNLEAKLSSFEHSIKQSVYNKVEERIDTMGCVEPGIKKTRDVTHKLDIYSLGDVLFEIMCGSKAYFQKEDDRYLASLAEYHNELGKLKNMVLPGVWLWIGEDKDVSCCSKFMECVGDWYGVLG
ncbi:putative receptor-like protein kinase At5g59700 [Bidens hawaiensis]|uniref:putative receptor-like protein kinase At5g59700 n=1 Tax=Bidens hawaiensis TaxID=980011 RepID=UPI004049D85A